MSGAKMHDAVVLLIGLAAYAIELFCFAQVSCKNDLCLLSIDLNHCWTSSISSLISSIASGNMGGDDGRIY